MIRGTSKKRFVASLIGAPRFWLGLATSLVAVLLAARDVRWFEVGGALSQANALWLSLALGTFLLTTWLKAVRWRLLFYPQHSRLPLRACLSVLMVGQLANNVLPARSGDLIRAFHMGRSHGTGGMLALATVVVEKAMDSVMLLLLMGVLSLRVSMPPWLRRSGIAISSALAASLLVLMVVASQRVRIIAVLESWIARYPRLGFLRVAKRLAEASGELGALRAIRVQVLLWGLSLVIWIVALSTNALVARSIDLPVDADAASLLLIVLMVGAILPASPLQLGVFHYLCILTLSLVGVDRSTAMTYAVLLHVVVFLPIVLGGVAGLWLESLTLHEPESMQGGAGA